MKNIHSLFVAPIIGLLAAGTVSLAQPMPNPNRDFWFADGPVNAIHIADGAVYLGGEFSYVGPQTGPAAVFDLGTGEYLGRFPRANGAIYAIEPDGAGGWFVAGEFTTIGGVARACVAHVLADLKVDKEFNAQVSASGVYALIRDQETLYIGGAISRIAGVNRQGLAALETATGALKAWNADMSGRVYAMGMQDGLIYLGGNFSGVAGETRQNLAAIEVATVKAAAWNPNADSQVLALAVKDNVVYVGGQFTSVGGKPRNRLAALDATTGQASNWNPNPNATVRCLAVTDAAVYVGGEFTTISLQNRNKFAGVNRGNGAALPITFQIEGTQSQVRTIKTVGSSIYIGGYFAKVQNRSQPMIAAADLVSGEALMAVPLGTLYNGNSDDAFVLAMASSGNRLAVAGTFQSLGGQRRTYAAALSESTGEILPWNPASLSHPVRAITSMGGMVYLGGGFTNVNATSVSGVAALDASTGELAEGWEFYATNGTERAEIRCLLAGADRVFAGGAFTAVGDKTVRMLAAVNPTNGAPLAFDAKIGGGYEGVTAVTRSGDMLYLAGDFNRLDGAVRTRLGAVNALTGAREAWAPEPNRTVSTLCAAGERLFVGGEFTHISGIDIRQIASYETASGELSFWDASLPPSAGGISFVHATETSVFLAGFYDGIAGEYRAQTACVSPFMPQAYEWDPAPSYPPRVIAVSERLVCLGGAFRFVGKSPNALPIPNFAVYERNAGILTNRVQGGKLVLDMATGERTRAVLQSTIGLLQWAPVATNDSPGYIWKSEQPISAEPQRFFRVVAE